uniref:Alpha-(1,6)-fucosyltransferase N- and catalytic domain-containing protein n=1 Tax=Lotharella oceanica TaxID=641309 RepID=A0A7S2TIQ6_9EUKA|mmetsp:Transcript_1565/g.2951  ORF Transcript_1565/g.2951 Transcript_1565/m.2951 type:complete len:284 (+) Transcript_1565:2-853(+)
MTRAKFLEAKKDAKSAHQVAATSFLSERVDDKEECIAWWEVQYDTDDDKNAPLQENCAVQFSHALLGEAVLPPAFQNKGLFFTVAQITKGLYELAPKVQARIEAKKRRIGWPENSPIIGLHVRLGDACIKSEHSVGEHGRHCNNLKDFMPHVRKMSKLYAIKNIYLATDSNDAVRATAKYPNYTWIIDHQQKRHDLQVLIEKALHTNVINGTEEFMGVLKDVELLSDCQALVGKFTSNVDRLVYMRMFMKSGRCYKPFASLDSGWCFDHSVPSGRSDLGHFYC